MRRDACVRGARSLRPEERERARADHEAGRQIYNFRCYFCHGYSGDARTLAASMIEPAPRDFTRARDLDERRVLTALRQGVPGSAMASFSGTLSPREMELAGALCGRRVRPGARAQYALPPPPPTAGRSTSATRRLFRSPRRDRARPPGGLAECVRARRKGAVHGRVH
jgi:hypothetical protein